MRFIMSTEDQKSERNDNELVEKNKNTFKENYQKHTCDEKNLNFYKKQGTTKLRFGNDGASWQCEILLKILYIFTLHAVFKYGKGTLFFSTYASNHCFP